MGAGFRLTHVPPLRKPEWEPIYGNPNPKPFKKCGDPKEAFLGVGRGVSCSPSFWVPPKLRTPQASKV